jgi:hypothetical protein
VERGDAGRFAARLGPGKTLGLLVAVLVLGTWGFANAHAGSFWDDLYRAAQLIPLHSGADYKHVTLPLQAARFLAVVADAVVLTAVGSLLLLRRDLPNRMRLRSASDHVIVCGAGVHGSRMVKELARGCRVVVIDVDDQAPGMKERAGSREVHLVDDAVSRETLRRAGIAKASRVVAVTGDDFVNSQIASTVRALAREGRVRDGLELFVQIEDPGLARSLEEPESGLRPALPRLHVFTPNALAAAALLGEGDGPDGSHAGDRADVLADLEKQGRPHLLLVGDHPLLEAVILGVLRRRRAQILRDAGRSESGPAVRVSLIGPGAVGRIERLMGAWTPEPEAIELEAEDIDAHDETAVLANRWIRDRRAPGHCVVACEKELDSIELTVTMSRLLEPGVPLTRVTTQPASELDRQLHPLTRHTVLSIVDLAWGGDGVERISAANRVSSALARAGGSGIEDLANKVMNDRSLGIRTNAAPRISPGNRPLVQALLEAVDANVDGHSLVLLSALVRAGVTVDLDAPENLRRAAERLTEAGGLGHDSFRTWCEYARSAPDETLATDPRPSDPFGASIVRLRLAARARDGSIAVSARSPVPPDASRISIFAGGAGSMAPNTRAAIEALLTRALKHYDGLILTGGTTVGLPGAARAAARAAGLTIIGYAPSGYGEAGPGVVLRHTDVSGVGGETGPFSERDPLAMWEDILASGFNAANVRLVAFPGGEITRSEIVLARTLGAKVVWLDPSSESELGLDDDLPLGAEGVLELPPDAMTLRAFLAWPLDLPEGWPTEAIARYLHNDYREKHRDTKPPGDPALAPWESLLPALQRSNRAAAVDIPNKLGVIGRRAVKGGSRLRLTAEEIELLAELEHGRYNYERLSAGWQLGERQILRLINPSLKPWDELGDKVKQWDRDSVMNIDPALEQAGWGVESSEGLTQG